MLDKKERRILKEIIAILKKYYVLVVFDTFNSPYPGYEGYIQKIDRDIIYLSHSLDEDAYVIIPISSIIDIYATNIEMNKSDIGKVKIKINNILDREIEKEEHIKKDYKNIQHQLFHILRDLKSKNDSNIYLKIYTKSVTYPIYEEVTLEQINTITPNFIFVCYIENEKDLNSEIMMIIPLKFIDSIIIYSDDNIGHIKQTEKLKCINEIYIETKEKLLIAKQRPSEDDNE